MSVRERQYAGEVLTARQLPELGLLYGQVQDVKQGEAWTVLELRDETGAIKVFVPSKLLGTSGPVAEDLVLVTGRSGRSRLVMDANLGAPAVHVQDPGDIALGEAAYNQVRRLIAQSTGGEEASQAAHGQPAEGSAHANGISDGQPPASAVTNANGRQTESIAALEDEQWRALARCYAGALETATAVAGDHAQRHPDQRALLEPRVIKDIATTLFIQALQTRRPRS